MKLKSYTESFLLPKVYINNLDYIYSNIEDLFFIESILNKTYEGAFKFTNFLYRYYFNAYYSHFKGRKELKAFTETEYKCYLLNNGFTLNEIRKLVK